MLQNIFLNFRIVKNLLKIQLIVGSLLLLVATPLKAQQEPMYSQYMFNMLNVNPAYAGNRAVDNISLLYRIQWVNISGAPKTGTISWDRRQEGTNVGYGLQVYNDQLGIESTSGMQAFYSYRISFSESFLSFGLSAGVLYYRAAYSQASTTQSGDPLFYQDVTGWLPTIGIGALYATDNWYVGLSVPALLNTKLNIYNQGVATGANNHYFLTGGYIVNASDVFKLKPSLMVKAVAGAPIEYDFNLNGWINDVVGLGVSYRTNDAFVGMFELQISPKLRVGYAYDYLVSNLKTYTKGTHELMLRYEFNHDKKNQRILSPRYY
ncbi:MAG: type IX secretion system membrane protein PorP/SprF [Paludibacter sp.]|nr:type IX secretion system membrane protein PorP/SprF [Paludibacter sp.]